SERPRFLVHGYDYKGGIARLRRLVADLDLEQRVEIEGVVAGASKRDFLQRAEGYVHASRWECHSTALLENLALGVPCLVSSSIHIAAPLGRAGAALLTAPTVESLREKLVELSRRREELARSGRSFVRDGFAWNRIIPAYLGALQGLGAT
ncbi:MAG TPA: glycosyltransferase, partial [Gemmatimonadales bacterium]